MNQRIRLIVVLAFAAAAAASATAHADSLWKSLIPFQRVDADPQESYRLSQDNGPWMVLVSSFVGDGAEQQARQLVIELRKRYKLPAYTHQRSFDFTQPVQGLGCNRYGQPKMMKYANAAKYDEVAVLVGDYEAVDSPAIQKTLEKVKVARPKCLELQPGHPTTQRFAALRDIQRRLHAGRDENQRGPMAKAFVTRNPMLPEEYFSPKGLDPLVVQMNGDADHSLLNNPGKYTVQVATFRGKSTMNLKEIASIEATGRFDGKLEDAAINAHKLTLALRKRKYEAYEFHDLRGSIVTIGSFDWVGKPRQDGKEEINPAVHKIMQTFAAQRAPLPGQQAAGLCPRTLEGIPFDVQPLPVEVPRASIAASYAPGRSLLP